MLRLRFLRGNMEILSGQEDQTWMMKKIGLFPFDNVVIQCLEMFSIYQYSSHILKFKEVEKQGFYCQDIKSHPKCKERKEYQGYIEGECGHSKGRWNVSQSINPLISRHFPHTPRGRR